MKISYQWLKQFININEPPETVGNMLTGIGLEVEAIHPVETIKGGLAGVVIGQVLTCQKHPNADKLSLTTVDIGNSVVVPIVCGAPNVAAGQKVLVATVGTTLYPTQGEPFTIKKAKIRGELSEGMICAEDELGLGTSHEGIMVLDTELPPGTPAAELLQLENDYVFEIGLTPNHADAASHYGVARELHALTGLPICFPPISELKTGSRRESVQVIVENTEACPRYSGLTISGIQVKDSPEWLKKRLQAIGLTPINNVVDVTNYVLHELGQPLHAFDLEKIACRTIRVKTLPEGTPFRTLDDVERKLTANDLMICDGNSQPLCIGGVFGGKESGISNTTTAIFLESAYFHPGYIRSTALHHRLKTDAAYRFERGTDPNMTVRALQRAAALITEIAGGEVSSDIIDIYPQPIPHRQFAVKYKNIDRLIGKKLDRALIHQILERLDIKVLTADETSLTVSVPPFRVDIFQQADIVEEILRIYGFDKVELKPSLSADYLAEYATPDLFKIRMELTKLLAANGFQEIITNSLTKPAYAEALGLPAENNVEIVNRLSAELAVMRRSLLFSGLEVLAHNISHRQKDFCFFEFGKTYYKQLKPEGTAEYVENELLALFTTGNRHAETWQAAQQKTDFFQLAGIVQKVLQKLAAHTKVTPQEIDSSHIFAYGLALTMNKREVARVGLVQPSHLKLLDIKQEVFYAEIDWTYLAAQLKQPSYSELSRFPEVRRDLSLVLDRQVSFDQIRRIAYQTERQLLKTINVFDVFTGESIGSDKKAYAISFILQDQHQTLTDHVIDKTMEKLMHALERQLGAVIRK
ncbi:MAG: phenylalanine--tRNA ligase subunit beta [Cytophagales bacterium]|nr:phenylalanine--tRNA ligase subunit beta [Bernardetiaceae bacterium]MDW8203554.1 phenylalanine--tRNA ligase subunit beta [Cytophagales bacterium]